MAAAYSRHLPCWHSLSLEVSGPTSPGWPTPVLHRLRQARPATRRGTVLVRSRLNLFEISDSRSQMFDLNIESEIRNGHAMRSAPIGAERLDSTDHQSGRSRLNRDGRAPFPQGSSPCSPCTARPRSSCTARVSTVGGAAGVIGCVVGGVVEVAGVAGAVTGVAVLVAAAVTVVEDVAVVLGVEAAVGCGWIRRRGRGRSRAPGRGRSRAGRGRSRRRVGVGAGGLILAWSALMAA